VLNSPRSTNRITQRYDVSIPELRFDWRDKRGSAHKELTRTSRPDAAANSLPNEMPSVMPADRQETAFWPAVIRYLMEGFALYGASVYPTGCFPEILRSNEKKTQQTRKVVLREHGYLSLVSPIASDGVAGELERDTNLTTSTGSEAAYAEDKLHEFDGVVSLQIVSQIARIGLLRPGRLLPLSGPMVIASARSKRLSLPWRNSMTGHCGISAFLSGRRSSKS
jgi:hypothetical protein